MALFGTGLANVIYQVPAKRRSPLLDSLTNTAKRPPQRVLLTTTAIASALASIGVADRAHAQAAGVCGTQVNGQVTCSPRATPHRSPIVYSTQPVVPGSDLTDPDTDVLDLSIAVESGVSVILPPLTGSDAAIRGKGLLSGAVSINAANGSRIRTSGARELGIFGSVVDGDLTIAGSNIVTRGDYSVGALGVTEGNGNADLKLSGIATQGRKGHGAAGYSYGGGSLTISADEVATYGDEAVGIYTYSAGGAVQITAGQIATEGFGAPAIYARGVGEHSVAIDGLVSTAGEASAGVEVATTAGDIAIFGEGAVLTLGEASSGVRASSQAGDVVLDLASVTTLGDYAPAIDIEAVAGNADVAVGSVVTSGKRSNGVKVRAGGDIQAALGSVLVLGDASNAIELEAGGSIDAAVGSVVALGADANALSLSAQRVALSVDGTITQAGDAQADTAAVRITARPGEAGPAIDDAGSALLVNNGAIVAAGANTSGVIISGTAGIGVIGTGSIESEADRTAALRFDSNGDAVIVQSAIRTAGAYSAGVTGSAAGNIAISIGEIDVNGAVSDGVYLRRGGTGSTSIDIGLAMLNNQYASAIYIQGDDEGRASGRVTASVDRLLSTADDVLAVFINAPGAEIDATIGEADLRGANSSAILATGTSVTFTGGSLQSSQAHSDNWALVEIEATQGTASVAIDRVQTAGDQAAGVRVKNFSDALTDVRVGSITTTGESAHGLEIRAEGGGAVEIAAREVTTTGDYSTGINLLAEDSDVSMNLGDISASGDTIKGVMGVGRAFDVVMSGTSIASSDYFGSATLVDLNASESIQFRNEGSLTVGTSLFGTTIRAFAGGDITITSTGTIERHSNAGGGIVAQAGGSLNIDVADLRVVRSYFGTAIGASSGYDTSIKVDRLEISGQATGIDVQSRANVVIEVGSAAIEDGVVAQTRSAGLTSFHSRGALVMGTGSSVLNVLAGDIDVVLDADVTVGTPGSVSAFPGGTFALATIDQRFATPTSQRNIAVTNNGVLSFAGNDFTGFTLLSGNDMTFGGSGSVNMTGNSIEAFSIEAAGSIDFSHASIAMSGDFNTGMRVFAVGDLRANIGSLTNAGDGALGIRASVLGETSIDIGTLAASGYRARGLIITGSYDVDLAIETLSAQGEMATGLQANTASRLAVNLGSASLEGEGSVLARLRATEGVDLVVRGPIVVTGDGSQAFIADSAASVIVEIDAIDVSGADSRVMSLQAGVDVALRTNGMITSAGDQEFLQTPALRIVGGESATFLNTGGVVTSGQSNGAVSISSLGLVTLGGAGGFSTGGDDATAVNISGWQGVTVSETSAITTLGDRSRGLILSTGGDANVTIGSVQTAGAYSSGVDVRADGDAAVRIGSVTTAGEYTSGVLVSAYGSTVLELGTGAVSGPRSEVALVLGNGDASVVIGDATVAGAGSRGIGTYVGGDSLIRVTGTVSGSADQQPRRQTVALPGDRVADSARAIIDGDALGVSRIVNDGAIRTSGVLEGGIAARGYAGVVVSGSGSVATSGAAATGIYAGANTNAAQVQITQVSTSGNDARGIFVRSFGTGSVQAQSVTTGGDRATGIFVEGAGLAQVTAGQVRTSGAMAHGIVAHAYGAALVDVAAVEVSGRNAIGIDALSLAQGDAAVTVSERLSVTGGGSGIVATAANGTASVRAAQVIHTGGGNGIQATGSSGALVEVTTLTSSGAPGAAIRAEAATGSTRVRGNSVAATGAGHHAIEARNAAGSVDVAVTSASASGTGAAGILAQGGGAVTITAGTVRNDAADIGAIVARGGSVAITADSVTAAGTAPNIRQAALTAQASGNATVAVRTVTASAGHDGIAIDAGGTAALTIAQGGSVTSNNDGIVLRAAAGSTLTNAGTIEAATAVRAAGGPTTVVNTGAIRGALVLTGAGDRVTNTGELTLTGGTDFGAGDDVLQNAGELRLAGNVDFGAGNDRLVNSGSLRLSRPAVVAAMAVSAATPLTRSVTGLESTANSGLIDLRDGVAGDTLRLSGSFVGSGASTLGLDVAFGTTPTADRLEIGGAATGSTRIVLRTTGNAQVLESGLTLVQAGIGTLASAFTLDPTQVDAGFFQRGIVVDTSNNAARLVSVPMQNAYRLLKVSEGARTLALEATDAVSAHMAAERDSEGSGRGLWSAMSGGVVSRSDTRTLTSFGLQQDVDLSYRQDGFSAQMGFDLDLGRASLGLSGGYASSVLGFDRSADQARYDAYNVGLYGTYRTGALFANLQAKYVRYDVDVRVAGQAGKTDGDGIGIRGELGMRLGTDGFFVEPAARMTWATARIDSLPIAATIGFDDRTGWTGAAGARFGATRTIGDARVTLYGGGDYVHTIDADQGVTFTTGSVSLATPDVRLPDHAVGRAGVSIEQGRVNGFIEGQGRFSSDYKGAGVRAGLRVAF